MDWIREISVAYRVKQAISEADLQGLWEFTMPELAASEADIETAERMLGFRLDNAYRGFLRHANGWRSFYQSVDLFGTEDLVRSSQWHLSQQLLDSLEDLNPLCGFEREELMPIAVSRDDIDLFTISTTSSHSPGVVCWFAGSLIESFPNFDAWFLAMVDYNRMEFDRLRKFVMQ